MRIYIIIKKEEIEKDETTIEDNDLFKSFWQKLVLVVCIRVYTDRTCAYIGLVWALLWMKLQYYTLIVSYDGDKIQYNIDCMNI